MAFGRWKTWAPHGLTIQTLYMQIRIRVDKQMEVVYMPMVIMNMPMAVADMPMEKM